MIFKKTVTHDKRYPTTEGQIATVVVTTYYLFGIAVARTERYA